MMTVVIVFFRNLHVLLLSLVCSELGTWAGSDAQNSVLFFEGLSFSVSVSRCWRCSCEATNWQAPSSPGCAPSCRHFSMGFGVCSKGVCFSRSCFGSDLAGHYPCSCGASAGYGSTFVRRLAVPDGDHGGRCRHSYSGWRWRLSVLYGLEKLWSIFSHVIFPPTTLSPRPPALTWQLSRLYDPSHLTGLYFLNREGLSFGTLSRLARTKIESIAMNHWVNNSLIP